MCLCGIIHHPTSWIEKLVPSSMKRIVGLNGLNNPGNICEDEEHEGFHLEFARNCTFMMTGWQWNWKHTHTVLWIAIPSSFSMKLERYHSFCLYYYLLGLEDFQSPNPLLNQLALEVTTKRKHQSLSTNSQSGEQVEVEGKKRYSEKAILVTWRWPCEWLFMISSRWKSTNVWAAIVQTPLYLFKISLDDWLAEGPLLFVPLHVLEGNLYWHVLCRLLDFNSFTGSIPDTFGNLSSLQIL